MAKGIDVDCMRMDCKFNKEAKCSAGRILVGDALDCMTYEAELDPSMALGGAGMPPGALEPASAPIMGAAPTVAPGGPPGGLEDLLVGGPR